MEDCGVSVGVAATGIAAFPSKPVSTRAWYIFIALCERERDLKRERESERDREHQEVT